MFVVCFLLLALLAALCFSFFFSFMLLVLPPLLCTLCHRRLPEYGYPSPTNSSILILILLSSLLFGLYARIYYCFNCHPECPCACSVFGVAGAHGGTPHTLCTPHTHTPATPTSAPPHLPLVWTLTLGSYYIPNKYRICTP